MNGPTWRCRLFLHRWAAWSEPKWEKLDWPINRLYPELGTRPRQLYTQECRCMDCGKYRWRNA